MSFKTLRPRQAAVPALALTALALALSACGGTSSASNSTTTTGGTKSFAAFSACLKQHGVTLPNNGTPPANGRGQGFGGAGLSAAQRTKFQAAQTACAALRPSGQGGFGAGRGGGANSAAFATYRNCLSLHGVKLQRPQPGAAPPSKKTQAALAACSSLRPAGFGAPPSSSGSG